MLTSPRIIVILAVVLAAGLGVLWLADGQDTTQNDGLDKLSYAPPEPTLDGAALPAKEPHKDSNQDREKASESSTQASADKSPSKKSRDLRKLISTLKTNAQLQQIFAQIVAGDVNWETRSDLLFLLEHWLSVDANAALDHALIASNRWKSFDLLYQIVELAGAQDFVDTQAWLSSQNLTESQKYDAITALYTGLAKKDPSSAVGYLANIDNKELRERTTASIVENWARLDAREAMAWLNGLTNSQEVLSNKALVIYQLIESDLALAGEFLHALPPSEQKSVVASSYAHRLALEDADAALTWAEALSYDNDPAYELAMASVLEVLATDPEGAWDAMEYVIAEGKEESQDALLNSVAIHIAAREPAALAQRLYDLPESSRRDIAVKISRSWAEKDAGKLKAWIDSLAPGEVKDGARMPLLEHYMNPAPDYAFRLAMDMDSPERKNTALRSVLSHWQSRDAQAAKNALANASGLTQSERDELLALID